MRIIKIIAFVTFLIVFIGRVYCQSDSSKVLAFIGANQFFYIKQTPRISFQEFQRINNSGNEILNLDVSKYDWPQYKYSSNYSWGGYINIACRFFKKHQDFITRFSGGIEFSDMVVSSGNYKETMLINHVTEPDSAYDVYESIYKNIYIRGYSTSIQINSAQLFYTNRKRLLSVYTGLSVNISSSLDSKIDASLSTWKYYYRIDSASGTRTNIPDIANWGSGKHSISKAKMYALVGLGVPLGFELRFSRKKNFWKHLSYGMEIAPTFNYLISPNLPQRNFITFVKSPIHLIYRF